MELPSKQKKSFPEELPMNFVHFIFFCDIQNIPDDFSKILEFFLSMLLNLSKLTLAKMVRNSIKVYARIKKEVESKTNKLESYFISKFGEDQNELIFHNDSRSDTRNSHYQFRYHKVFDQLSSQEEIFEIVAKPVVNSVINGFNGTIFAYGQTGSGKTYSITGCPKIYENRGIIPRSIEYIFEYTNRNPESYDVHLSYLEVYNEIGYDLLNPKHGASRLEEFPRVVLLEDGKGGAHLRNLSVHPVSTEKDAMRLLFLGDTNRTIADTPMNIYSSRSHCIFIIYLTGRLRGSNRAVKSKLYIVDLAGSERIGKSNITGSILNEAKNINLSLHYLEQVISALSSSKKHIPFRNSTLTSLLKDSLCGNSLTTMLATLAVTKKNMEQTISTCKFSERVSLVKTNPQINEGEFDSHQEINILQNEITELKLKLFSYEKESRTGSVTNCLPDQNEFAEKHEKHFGIIVEQFLSNKIEAVDMTLAEMRYCLEIMREMCRDKITLKDVQNFNFELDSAVSKSSERKYTSDVDKSTSRSMEGRNDPYFQMSQGYERKYNDNILIRGNFSKSMSMETQQNYRAEIEEYQGKLKQAYEEAKLKAEVIEDCQRNILTLKTRMGEYNNCRIKSQIVNELHREQEVYRRTILELKNLEKKTDHLKFGLLQAEMKLRKLTSYDCFQEKPIVDVSSSYNRDPVASTIGGRSNKYSFSYPTTFGTRCQSGNSRGSHSKVSSVYLDSNLPERENDCTKKLSNRHSIKANQEKIKDASYSYLQYIADGSSSIVQDQLGLLSQQRTEPELDCETFRLQQCGKEPDQKNFCYSGLQNQNHEIRNCYLLQNNPKESFNDEKYGYRENLPSKEVVNSRSSRREQPQLNYIEDELVGHKNNSNFDYAAELLKENQRSHEPHKSEEFIKFEEFMKSVPLTGDKDVDDEILNFYRSKFKT